MGGTRPARRLLLAGLLLLVLVASAGPNETADPPAMVAAVEREQATADRTSRVAEQWPRGDPHRNTSLDLSRLTRAQSRQSARDPFAPRSFYTPPRKPAPVVVAKAAPNPPSPPPAPPEPTAPPLPFTYMGSMSDDHELPMFFLVKGGNLYNVRLGDVIDGTYRVESVTGSSLRLIYLPLDIEQSLQMGDS